MGNNGFEIVFRGAMVPGADAAQVKKNLAGLFKTEVARVEPLFSGGRFVIKKGLDQATAQRYQKALREAGAIAEIVDPAASGVPGAARSSSTQGGHRPAPTAGSQPAPVSATAKSATVPVAKPPAGTSNPAASAAPRAAPEAAATSSHAAIPRIEASRLTLDKPGVVLVEHPVVPELKVDLSGLSMAEPGAILKAPETVRDLVVDTRGMTLAEPGVTLVEPERPTVPQIDTSKITLA